VRLGPVVHLEIEQCSLEVIAMQLVLVPCGQFTVITNSFKHSQQEVELPKVYLTGIAIFDRRPKVYHNDSVA
jgi:hypothetical protein